jgi:hypothetical protein
MRRRWSLLGAGLAGAFAIAFPVALGSLPTAKDLEAHVPGEKAFRVLERASTPAPSATVTAPFGSLRVDEWPKATGPGLSFTTWQVNQANRWGREVTLP